MTFFNQNTCGLRFFNGKGTLSISTRSINRKFARGGVSLEDVPRIVCEYLVNREAKYRTNEKKMNKKHHTIMEGTGLCDQTERRCVGTGVIIRVSQGVYENVPRPWDYTSMEKVSAEVQQRCLNYLVDHRRKMQ